METRLRKPFNKRAFAALTIAVAGIGLPVTGIANHIYQFEPMTLERHAWMSAHNVLGLLFASFALWHAYLNRRALLTYVKGMVARMPLLSREAILAVAVVALALFIFVGHAFHVQG
ncbi:MAG: DUF4405 domain-containing protein [Candidatus Hydrogenedentales bacterium]|jgi:hypothetical protein